MRLPADRARERFAGERVARFASVSGDGVPHLVPITFTVIGERIVFVVDDKPKSTRDLRRLANIAAHPQACALVDSYDDDWSKLWWARADGTASIAERDDEAVDALATRYPYDVDRRPSGPVVSIEVSRWSGWAAAGSPASDTTGAV